MSRVVSAALLSLVAVPAAAAAGPSLGIANGRAVSAAGVSYVTRAAGTDTRLQVSRGGSVVASLSLPGRWGMPLVTFGGEAGGLSHDGSTLVLARPLPPNGGLRSVSSFLVLRTRSLAAAPVTVRLRGDFSFDALSPHGRTLYLIRHLAGEDASRYVVRAYDLRTGRLLPGAIADKRQRGWTMRGYPARRVESASGRFVYTLYQPSGNYPFVHALDTVGRTAVCIGLPWSWGGNGVFDATLALRDGGRTLAVADHGRRAAIDTRTLRIVG